MSRMTNPGHFVAQADDARAGARSSKLLLPPIGRQAMASLAMVSRGRHGTENMDHSIWLSQASGKRTPRRTLRKHVIASNMARFGSSGRLKGINSLDINIDYLGRLAATSQPICCSLFHPLADLLTAASRRQATQQPSRRYILLPQPLFAFAFWGGRRQGNSPIWKRFGSMVSMCAFETCVHTLTEPNIHAGREI